LRAELDRLRRRLGLTLELIREIEAEQAEKATAAPDAAGQKATALARLRGVGATFAAVLTREVFYRHFDNRRQLGSYVGVAPMPHQSGTIDRDRRISRAGNPRARKALIQLAWLWLRDPPEAPSPAGSGSGSACSPGARGGSRSSLWRASSSLRSGATSRPASCRREWS
jgi:transposase